MTNGQTNWTVMVYFAGDNNLGEEMIWSLKDIHAATPLKNAKVVALFDGGGPPVTFRIDRKNPDKPVHKVSAQDGDRQILRQVDSARKSAAERKTPRRSEPIRATLTNFIKQNISDDPYERYMLILSGHGGGAVGEFLTSDKRILGLSIPALQSVLGEWRKEV